MEIVKLLLPVALALVVLAVVGFLWAARRGQFDDLETPGIRVLFDDEPSNLDVTRETSDSERAESNDVE